LKIKACLAGDLYAITVRFATHGSAAGAELSRAQFVLAQPPRPIRSQSAVDRSGSGVFIDADRRRKKSAHVIYIILARSCNDGLLCLFSAAIFCMILSAGKAVSMQTPGGITRKKLIREYINVVIRNCHGAP